MERHGPSTGRPRYPLPLRDTPWRGTRRVKSPFFSAAMAIVDGRMKHGNGTALYGPNGLLRTRLLSASIAGWPTILRGKRRSYLAVRGGVDPGSLICGSGTARRIEAMMSRSLLRASCAALL